MNNTAGQQRLTAFHDKQEKGADEKEARREDNTRGTGETFSDNKQDDEEIEMEETEQESTTVEEQKKDRNVRKVTGKRAGNGKGSPQKKQKQQEEEKQRDDKEEERAGHTPKNRNAKAKKNKRDDEDTPERNNHTRYQHVHVSRITIKLTVEGQKDMKVGMIKMFKEYLTEMRKADPNIQIYPWKEGDDNTKPRIKTENELTDIAAMQAAYGKNFFVYRNQGTMRLHPKIRIGHDASLEDIREETREWARANECNIFRDRLQFEKTTQVGWFCYTTRNFDAEALAEVVSRETGFQVDLQWRMVATGKKGKISDEQKTYALHVEVEDKGGQKYTYMNRLLKLYGRNANGKKVFTPNGVRMRFVKLQRDAVNTKEKEKLNRLRVRQKRFNSVILTEETDDIEQLDYCTDETEPTLREMIMEIKSEKYRDTPIFFSVDADWRGRGHVFSFSPKMEEEAIIMSRTLLPYLKHQYPEQPVEEYFTDEAISRCEGLVVDPITGRVKQLYEEELDEEEEDEMLGFDLQIDTSKAVATLTRPEKNRRVPGPEDEDSVSTLGGARHGTESTSGGSSEHTTGFKLKNISSTNHKKVGGYNDDMSVISSTSTVTMQTIATLEAKLDENVSAINNKLNILVSRLFKEDENNGTTASAKKIGSSKAGKNENAGEEESSSGDEPQN